MILDYIGRVGRRSEVVDIEFDVSKPLTISSSGPKRE